MNTVHTDLKQTAERTAKELANIREELKSAMAGVQKIITIVEEAKVAVTANRELKSRSRLIQLCTDFDLVNMIVGFETRVLLHYRICHLRSLKFSSVI
jgi:hypothetical protein